MLPIVEYIDHPRIFFSSLLKETGFLFPDKLYLQMMYYLKTGKRLDLTNPITFGEKLQWLKLYDRKPKYTVMVDKYAVKDYVARIIGEEYIIQTLGVWDRPEDIDFDALPNQFVLKTTHGGGSCGVVICKDKAAFNFDGAAIKLRKALKQDIYGGAREWAYKDVKKRIIAETYMTEPDGDLKDYKVFTFGGVPQFVELDYNRFKGHQRNLYDFGWNKINAMIEYPSDEKRFFAKPKVLGELYELSKKLSDGIPHVRIDFYIVEDHIYFGEFTFYHGSGYEKILPYEFDIQMGDWLKIPPTKIGG